MIVCNVPVAPRPRMPNPNSSNAQSRHCFGSKDDVETALQRGTIGKFDLIFCDEGSIYWIDKDGKIILGTGAAVCSYESKDAFPAEGSTSALYIDESTGLSYYWDGAQYAEVKSSSTYDDTELRELIAEKVDKVDGKGLSTNDFTDSYKEEIETISDSGLADAEIAVNSDIDTIFQ